MKDAELERLWNRLQSVGSVGLHPAMSSLSMGGLSGSMGAKAKEKPRPSPLAPLYDNNNNNNNSKPVDGRPFGVDGGEGVSAHAFTRGRTRGLSRGRASDRGPAGRHGVGLCVCVCACVGGWVRGCLSPAMGGRRGGWG